MSVTQYVGARYVPLFHTPIEWSDTVPYEPLTIVTHEGNSYTSKQSVPVGIAITDSRYWVVTGNYNAQVETYRRETKAVADKLDEVNAKADSAKQAADAATAKNVEQDRSISDVTASVSAETEAREEADTTLHTEIGSVSDAVTAETTERESADAELSTRIDTVSQAVATETDARTKDVARLTAEIAKAAASGLYKNVTEFGASVTKSDNSTEISNALKAGDAYLDGGNYKITNPIVIPSDRKLFGINGATITISSGDLGVTNEHDGQTTGYGQAHDIAIEGIKFVVAHETQCTTIGFSHAENISVVACEFSGNKKWHMIELNGCRRCVIDLCYFHDYGNSSSGGTEMVQLDYASGTGVFPWFGPYDNTGCTDVKITNNFFVGDNSKNGNIPSAIGNHTTTQEDNNNHANNVVIANNQCQDMGGFCKFVDLTNSSIMGNVVSNCRTGLTFSYGCSNIVVSGNILGGDKAGGVDSLLGRGVWAYANSATSYPSHISLMNNKVYSFATQGVSLQGRLHMVVGNEVTGCNMNGMYVAYAEGGSYYGNNICYGNGLDGDNYFDLYYNTVTGPFTDGMVGDNTVENNKYSTAKCVGSASGYHIIINNVFKKSFSTSVSNMKLHGNLLMGSLQADKNV